MEQTSKKLSESYYTDYLAMANEQARASNWKLFAVIVMLVALLSASFAAILVINHDRMAIEEKRIALEQELLELERSIDTTYEYDIEQKADDNSRNYWIGRDYYGSDTENQSTENDNP